MREPCLARLNRLVIISHRSLVPLCCGHARAGATDGLSVDAGIEESSGSVQAWMMVRAQRTIAVVRVRTRRDGSVAARHLVTRALPRQ